MIWLVLVLTGALAGSVCVTVTLYRALDFAYTYAVRRSEGFDPAGRAYSDMATVLILCRDADGRRQLVSDEARKADPS